MVHLERLWRRQTCYATLPSFLMLSWCEISGRANVLRRSATSFVAPWKSTAHSPIFPHSLLIPSWCAEMHLPCLAEGGWLLSFFIFIFLFRLLAKLWWIVMYPYVLYVTDDKIRITTTKENWFKEGFFCKFTFTKQFSFGDYYYQKTSSNVKAHVKDTFFFF